MMGNANMQASNLTTSMLGHLAKIIGVIALLIVVASPLRALEIKKVTSPGGITAWLVENHTIPMIAMNFSMRGGAAVDPVGKEGLAHFLSGMLDEGAGDLDSTAFQARVEELVMHLSFDTDLDEFNAKFRTLTENRDEAFAMVKLALTAPRFDKVPLERIRSQLLLARRQDKEDPSKIASAAWMKTMFGSHPYSRRSNGTIEGIEAVGAEDLRELAKRLFAREGLLISVVGDIDEETLKRLLDDTFGGLPEKSGIPVIQEAAVTNGPIVGVIDRNIPQSIIRFGHGGIKRNHPDFIAAYIMNHILGAGGFGSRLMEEVREKRGLSYSVYSTLYPLEKGAVFYGGAATVNDRAAETVKVLRAELKRMADNGPTQKELDEAKTYLTGSYALRFDSNRKIARELLGIQQVKLGIDYVNTRNDKIRAISLEDVRRVAKRIIDADDLVITIVGRPKDVKPVGKAG